MTAPHTLVVGMMQTPPYDRMFEQSRRVYSAKGISPTLHTQGGGIERLRYWWSCKNVRSISPTTPIFAHITDMIRMRLTSFSFVSPGDKQKQHFIYDTISTLGRLHSHTHYRRAASWQHTGVHPQVHRRQALGWRGRRSHLFAVGGRNAPWPWGGKTADGGSRKRTEALRHSVRRNIVGRTRLSTVGVAMVRKVGLCRKSF